MKQAEGNLRAVFCEATEIDDPAARSAFLDDACRGDEALRARVEQLLAADSNAGGFLQDTRNRPELESAQIGQRLGRYRLVERLGQGGYGVVFRAEQVEPVRRQVALKIIKLGMDTGAVVARFELERQALAMMDHPSIARVLDAGATETGRPYFVMELVRGQTITKYCQQHSLSVRQRLELFIQVCQAVQHAHQKGIIHRDLKPSNILVTEQDGMPVPKIIDFGIAKATEVVGRAGVTTTYEFVGTPAYMSPEQVTPGARDIDTRSDIYGLGVILYELMAGQPPYDVKALANAGLEEMRRIIREVDPPRPSALITKSVKRAPTDTGTASREQLSALRGDLDWIVMKCLEKDRTRRYETANALAMDLRRHLDHEPVVARPPSGVYRLQKIVRRNRLWFGAGATVGLVLLGAAFVSIRQAYRATRAEHEQSRLRGIAESKAAESEERLVRRYVAEGNRLIEQRRPFAALPWLIEALELETGQRQADERLRIAQALDGTPSLRLHLSQGKRVQCIALSPDGERVATGSQDGVVRITALASAGAVFTNLSLPGLVGTVQFSPDGSRLVAADLHGWARVWKAETAEPLTPVMRAQDFNQSLIADLTGRLKPTAQFHPDGKHVLMAWGSQAAELRESDSSKVVRRFIHGGAVLHAAFNHDGTMIVTSARDGEARVWDVETGEPVGESMRHSGMVAWSQFSGDGEAILTVRERKAIQLWKWRDGRRVGAEIVPESVLFQALLSPDGTRILAVSWGGMAQLYDAATGQILSELRHDGGLVDAAFSPDGKYFTTACFDGNAWVWKMEDLRAPFAILPLGDELDRVTFSGNGELLGVAGRGGRARVWTLFPDKPGVRRFAGEDVRWVEFDPACRRVVVAGGRRDADVRVYDVESGRQLSHGKLRGLSTARARFSPDGTRLLVRGPHNMVHVLDAATGREALPQMEHKGTVREALWSQKWIVTASEASGVRFWDVTNGSFIATIEPTSGVREIALSPDGTRLAAACADHTVRVWNTASREQVLSPWQTHTRIQKVAFSPDGRRIATASFIRNTNAIVEVRDVATGALVGRPIVQRNEVNDFEFSRDGRLLATAGEDRNARVWDAETGEPISPWMLHSFEGQQAHLSPDGQRLVTVASRGHVRLWNGLTGEPITAPLDFPPDQNNFHAQFSSDGGRLLFTTGGQDARILDLRPEPAGVAELKLLAMTLSCTQVDSIAGATPLDDESLDKAWRDLQVLRGRR